MLSANGADDMVRVIGQYRLDFLLFALQLVLGKQAEL
jgi:hypothetical protein